MEDEKWLIKMGKYRNKMMERLVPRLPTQAAPHYRNKGRGLLYKLHQSNHCPTSVTLTLDTSRKHVTPLAACP